MKQKQNAIFFIILSVIFIACATLYLWAGDSVTHSSSDNGTRDLRGADFSTASFDLYGPVEYISNEFLTPEQFAARQRDIRTGDPAGTARYSTSRLRVYVPAGTYGLMMWNAEFAANIYINGRLMESVGVPAADAAHSTPGVRLLYFTADAPNGVIEIVQQTSNHVLPEGGGHADVVIGKADVIRSMYNKQNTIPSVVMGCFLALVLAHLVLYSMRRFYKANLWFALFCFVWFLRTGYTHPWVLSSLFSLPWVAVFRLDCLTYPAGLLLLSLTLHALFPGVLQKWFRAALAAVCGGFAMLCLFAGTVFVREALTYFYAVIFLVVIYIIIRLCMKVRRPDVEQIAVLVGMGIFIFGALWDILRLDVSPALLRTGQVMSDLTAQEMTKYTLLVFVFFQMAAMFRGTMREMTAARDAEQKLAIENAMLAREAKVREEMVHTLSHEVRTPLTVISTYAQLAVRQFRQGKLDEQVADGLDAINEEAQRLAKLASGVLSPKEKDESVADLAEIARQLVRLYLPVAQNTERQINANLEKRLPVSCDAGEITQIIWNLLDNAFKHGSGDIDVDGNLNDEYAYIIISDYGKGIPPELLPRILERGVSEDGGSGIGLAIADEIARKHGGRLTIESEYELGTTATLLLPVYRGKAGNDI